ncbi:MAG: hypothetical protein DI598_11645 [Pseudopedobacter saltans]|uniref:Uncharacterized protein n=1 Tax=Pseudopedobacter saltans TaxID=151895 RepID=A0A2W5ES79_9SPHI|nr:MAG: hypothetical protein DI598_11645 [Pseudopedobacter saltans]
MSNMPNKCREQDECSSYSLVFNKEKHNSTCVMEIDIELSFSIEPQCFTKMYAGRGVLHETLDEFGDLYDL